ncbi:MAG: hypothetical protein ABI651_03570 [Verrucomicrobiota bacterium]
MRVRLTTDTGPSWRLEGSTNLLDWLPIITVEIGQGGEPANGSALK